MDTTTIDRSTKVRGYVKATIKYRKLTRRIDAIEADLTPIRRRAAEMHANLKMRWNKMTGPQQRHAERLLGQPEELLELMTKPCNPSRD